jgi:hypothetical protein
VSAENARVRPGFPNHRLRGKRRASAAARAEPVFRRDRRTRVAIHEFFRTLPYDYTAICKTTGTDFNIVRSVFE